MNYILNVIWCTLLVSGIFYINGQPTRVQTAVFLVAAVRASQVKTQSRHLHSFIFKKKFFWGGEGSLAYVLTEPFPQLKGQDRVGIHESGATSRI
jgi:hypothetical protein